MCLPENDTFFFSPVALKNIIVVNEVQSLSPIMQLEMLNLGKQQLLVACGRGQSSTLRILQRQLVSNNYEFLQNNLQIYSPIIFQFKFKLNYL